MHLPLRSVVAAICLASAVACASAPPPRERPPARPRPQVDAEHAPVSAPALAARTALSMLGVPYRYGGASPRGFDCSGLVIYSYAAAGLTGLPHSALALERRSTPIALAALEPGDLLFFDLDRPKTSHVGIYLGDAAFVHAPSPGKRVERVPFDHVYWGSRIQRAGRLPKSRR